MERGFSSRPSFWISAMNVSGGGITNSRWLVAASLIMAVALTATASKLAATQPTLAGLLDDQADEPAVETRPTATVPVTANQSPEPPIARDSRTPVPAATTAKASLATVREVFEKEFSSAKTPEQLVALAQLLLEESAKTKKTAEAWALLQQSLASAIASGNLDVCEQVIGRLAELFAVDSAGYRVTALTQLAMRPHPDSADAVAVACLRDGKAAAAVGDYGLAKKLLGLGQGVARKTRNQAALAQFKDAFLELKAGEKAAGELETVKTKYEADPNDQQAAAALGRHYCFVVRDWQRGLPLLARGADQELGQLAAADLRAAANVRARVSAADAWLTWAQKQKGQLRDAGSARAVELYSEARPKLDGLERTRVEKKIQEAAAIEAPSGRKAWLADLPHERVTGAAFGFSKDGTYRDKPYTCAGQPCSKSLRVMPGSRKKVSVVYAIPQSAKRLVGHAGVFVPEEYRNNPRINPATPLNFEIRLDGRTIWKSRPLAKCNDIMPFDVVVAGGGQLELVTTSENANSAFAAWIEPFFVN
jgi:hypothetical protein